MKKIPGTASATFLCVHAATATLGIGGGIALSKTLDVSPASLPPVLTGFLLFYFANILFLKLFLRLFPFPTGTALPGSQEEFIVGVYLLFYIFHIAPVNFSRLLPAPFTSLWYRFLGARIGKNSFPAASVLAEPHLIALGDEVTLGFNCVLTPHVMVGESLSHERIVLGDRVTVGVNTVIYGGVKIGDGALVLANSSVVPGTRIGENEMWGGNPAKKVKVLKPGDRAWNGVPQTASPVWAGEKGLEIARGV